MKTQKTIPQFEVRSATKAERRDYDPDFRGKLWALVWPDRIAFLEGCPNDAFCCTVGNQSEMFSSFSTAGAWAFSRVEVHTLADPNAYRAPVVTDLTARPAVLLKHGYLDMISEDTARVLRAVWGDRSGIYEQLDTGDFYAIVLKEEITHKSEAEVQRWLFAQVAGLEGGPEEEVERAKCANCVDAFTQAGFENIATGGNCEAYAKRIGRVWFMITGDGGCCIPDTLKEPSILGIYEVSAGAGEGMGEQLGFWEGQSAAEVLKLASSFNDI